MPAKRNSANRPNLRPFEFDHASPSSTAQWPEFLQHLHASYCRLEEAQRIAGLGHWSFRRSCEPVQWSDDCLGLLGLERDAVLNYRQLSRCIHPDDRPALKDRIDAAVHDARPFEIEVRLRQSQGAIRWVRVLGQPERDDHGLLCRLHGTVMDVTRRKLVELRESMEHAVARLLAEAESARATLPEILEAMCQTLGWVYGAMWMLEPRGGTLVRHAHWALPAPRVEAFARLAGAPMPPPCASLLRMPLQAGQPAWSADVGRDPDFPRAAAARHAGLAAALAFPVQAGTEILGVVELYAQEPQQPDRELMSSAHFIGCHIGQVLQRESAEAALRESEAHFRALVEQASDSFFLHDGEGRLIDVNQRACDSLGYRRSELLALDLADIDADLPARRLKGQSEIPRGGAGSALESRYRRRDGSLFPVEIRTGPIEINGRQQLLSLVRDVTERKAMQDHIQHLAYHDALTGLPNRAMFNRRLSHALVQARRYQRALALLFIDLDRFKNINDTLGHDAGDRLLQEMARRLGTALRGGDLVARLGGDEFVVLVEEAADRRSASQVARQILAALVREYCLAGQAIHVTASIGIAIYPEDGRDGYALMKHADIAMYRAKAGGKNNFQSYSASMDVHAAGQLALESSLRRAIEHDELMLHYQPKVEAGSGRICGMEALVRWRHPELGCLGPDCFIPLAEETGLIVPLTKWVLRQACRQNRDWLHQGLPPLRMAVNLSARHFSEAGLQFEVAAVLRAAGLPPALLELEITESTMMQDSGNACAVLSGLKRLGVRIAIDDFGIGYSSLAQLKRFPIDIIKIDRAFIADIPGNAADEALTETIIGIGRSLKIRVVAEGVEQTGQVDFLRRHGCDELQGHYFSRPLPAEEFQRLLLRDMEQASYS